MSRYRYVIDESVAPREGGFAKVFRGVREHDGAPRALKFLRNDQDPEHLARFRAEARIQMELRHPNIVAVDDVHIVQGETFLAMEFIDGGTLRDLMNEGMDDESKIRAVQFIAGALSFAHDHDVVHRDLKPENVLYDRVRRVLKLSDFGVAHQGGFSLGLTHGFIGTRSYAAPEQIATGYADARSDIYALGVMIHELFFGTMPQFRDGHLLRWETYDDTPVGFRNLVARMLSYQPDERYQSVSDFLADFDICVFRKDVRSVLPQSFLEKVGKVAGVALLVVIAAAALVTLAKGIDSAGVKAKAW